MATTKKATTKEERDIRNAKDQKRHAEKKLKQMAKVKRPKPKYTREERSKNGFSFFFAHPDDLGTLKYRMAAEDLWGHMRLSDLVQKGPRNWFVKTYPWSGLKSEAKKIVKENLEEVWMKYLTDKNNKPRQKNEINLPYPHPRQKAIIYSKRRFKVMVCGRRFGKTTAALIACVMRAAKEKKQQIFYIAPTYKQAKNIAWSILTDMIGEAYTRKNEQDLAITLPNDSKIFLKGADNPDSLRGTKAHLVIMDEFADMKPNVWEEIIRPQLADTRGDAWFLGTPRGFDHFYRLWMRAFKGELGKDWEAYRLTTYDNPYIPREEIDAARATSDERSFSQEYLAEFVQFSGLVYQDFNRELVQEFDITGIPGVDVVGVDFGADHPTAAAFCRITPGGKVYVWAEYYRREVVAADVVEGCKKLEKKYKATVRRRYLDPSAKGFSQELKKLGYKTEKAVNDRNFGISKIRSLLRSGNLVIHPSCTNLIYEFEHHRYKSVKEKSGSALEKDAAASVLKIDDDALDALRYGLASYFRSSSVATGYRPAGSTGEKDYGGVPVSRRISFDKVNLGQPHRQSNGGMPMASEFKGI